MLKKFFSILILPSFLLAACDSELVTNEAPVDENEISTQTEEIVEPIKIVTTFPPLYSFATNIAGEQAEVTNLVEPGASVHIWEPTASDLRALSEADLLVMNGLELEPFIEDMMDAAQNPTLKVVTTADFVSSQIKDSESPLELDHEEAHEERHEDEDHEHDHEEDEHEHDEDEHEDHDDEHGHSHGGQDPHIWLNPELAMIQVEAIRDALIEIDPNNASIYEENTTDYLATLTTLDQEIDALLADVEQKPFIVFHDAYLYYFDRYNLMESRKAAIEPFPGKEPTAAYFQELVALIEQESIEIVFTEPQFNPQTVQNLQEETGVKSFEINPIGLGLSEESYEENLRALTDAFVAAFE